MTNYRSNTDRAVRDAPVALVVIDDDRAEGLSAVAIVGEGAQALANAKAGTRQHGRPPGKSRAIEAVRQVETGMPPPRRRAGGRCRRLRRAGRGMRAAAPAEHRRHHSVLPHRAGPEWAPRWAPAATSPPQPGGAAAAIPMCDRQAEVCSNRRGRCSGSHGRAPKRGTNRCRVQVREKRSATCAVGFRIEPCGQSHHYSLLLCGIGAAILWARYAVGLNTYTWPFKGPICSRLCRFCPVSSNVIRPLICCYPADLQRVTNTTHNCPSSHQKG